MQTCVRACACVRVYVRVCVDVHMCVRDITFVHIHSQTQNHVKKMFKSSRNYLIRIGTYVDTCYLHGLFRHYHESCRLSF